MLIINKPCYNNSLPLLYRPLGRVRRGGGRTVRGGMGGRGGAGTVRGGSGGAETVRGGRGGRDVFYPRADVWEDVIEAPVAVLPGGFQ